jgi:Rad3-related DNA helicase
MDVFPEEKGLIHAPSYQASLVVYNALKSTGRIVMHDKDNFQETLLEFYKDKNPNVIISPICSEGVDFKGERARFQMILRVPYPNANDPLMAKKYKEDYGYVNYKALVTFGQQIGRVNRSETDFGVTVLMDSRFESFIYKNKSLLPGWVKEALIY